MAVEATAKMFAANNFWPLPYSLTSQNSNINAARESLRYQILFLLKKVFQISYTIDVLSLSDT